MNKLIVMPPKTKITLTDAQKYEFCLYAHHNRNVRVSESTVSRILQKKGSALRLRLMHQDIDQLHFRNLNKLRKSLC